jgi:hypothetical protein
MLLSIALLGGLLSVLTFIHFAIDWIPQSHYEAMNKYNNPKIRAKHCLIYTAGFIPFFLLCHFSWVEWLVALNILFWSHFVEDTYLPVFLWAKYIRKPPEMQPDPKSGFIEFVQTPLGKILMIAIDQIIHILFLFPIAYMILQRLFVEVG